MSVLATLVGGGILLCIFWKILLYFRFQLETYRRLSWIKNPVTLPLIGNAHQLACSPNHLFNLLVKWSKDYGGVYKFWVGTFANVVIQAPDIVQTILKSTINIDKSIDYQHLRPYIGEGLLTSTGSKWHSRRKLLTNSFHLGIIEKQTGQIIDVSRILVSCLKKRAEDEKIFDLMPYLKLCTLDVMMETSIGKKINALTNPRNEYVLAVNDMLQILIKRATTFLKNDLIFRLSPYYKKQVKAADIIRGFSAQVIKERRIEREQTKAGRQDKTDGMKRMALMDLLLETDDLSDADIQEEVDTFVFEGHDTTASGVSFSLYLLGHHPEAQKLIVEELDMICPNFKEDGITYSQLGKLEYLERCIKESLRIYPPVILIGRNITTSIETEKGKIPSGTSLALHIHNTHHNEEIFPNPMKFDPDRFLPENSEGRHPFAYIPFSAGPRNCIGKRFAVMEMKILILAVMKNYVVKSIDKQEDLKQILQVINNTTNGIRVKLTKRV